MKHSCLLALGIVALAAYPAAAQQILYQENFDTAALSSTSAGPGSYVAVNSGTAGWQIQGGTDGGNGGTVSLAGGINNNGVGGSQALFGTWDFSTGTNYTWNQYSYYGVGGAGAGATLADIQVSLDVLVSGASGSVPITVSALQNSGNSSLDYAATLPNDQYTHLAFNLGQSTASGSGGPFDPTAGFWFRVSHGVTGFGFDNGNTLQIDNVMITVVPEPATVALLALGSFGWMFLRRRS